MKEKVKLRREGSVNVGTKQNDGVGTKKELIK